MGRLFAPILAVLALGGCSPNLGDAPFKCSSAGQCPDGYDCNAARICVKQGVCAAGAPGCPAGCGDRGCSDARVPDEGGLPDAGPEPDHWAPPDRGPRSDLPATPDCIEDETKCDDEQTLRYCEAGKWQVETCESLCTSSGGDYGIGCQVLSQTGQDGCLCGMYAQFGEQCTDEVLCAPDLFCGAFSPLATVGFCTKYCSNPNGLCPGGPAGTKATCSLEVGGQDVCAFVCEDLYTNCPQPMVCDFDLMCKP